MLGHLRASPVIPGQLLLVLRRAAPDSLAIAAEARDSSSQFISADIVPLVPGIVMLNLSKT